VSKEKGGKTLFEKTVIFTLDFGEVVEYIVWMKTRNRTILIGLWDEGKALDKKHIEETIHRMWDAQYFQSDLTGTMRIEAAEDGFHIIWHRTKKKGGERKVGHVFIVEHGGEVENTTTH
jgi:uncharacterized membrane protein